MRISDRPGRFFALVAFAPTLVVIAWRIVDTHPNEAMILKVLGTLLFTYECFWITRSTAEIVS